MKVIVGLGNPGKKYAGTRHNVGFEVVDYLADGPGVRLVPGAVRGAGGRGGRRRDVAVGEARDVHEPERPERCGRSLDFYKLPVEHVLVVCDDFNLPLGKLRVRAKGSHGGQNGLRNIQEQLGTDAYPRLRIGVGQPGPGDAVDFVLSRFKPGEKAAVEKAVADAATAALLWATDGIEACMNAVNGPPPKPRKPVAPRPKPEAGSNEGAPPREPQ